MDSFVELFGHRPLNELFSEWQPAPLSEETDGWANFPPESFLAWCLGLPRSSFDGVPPNEQYKKQPTFLIGQSHRVWLSANLIAKNVAQDGAILDFGSYPFVVPIAMRDYFKHRGLITGTVIQPMDSEGDAYLRSFEIGTDCVDLDPYVVDMKRGATLPRSLNASNESQDLVSMFHVIEHLYHPIPALAEAYRVLRPGGRMVITTDNAMMLNTLSNFVAGYGYTFEPVEDTAAMTVHDWRGHVRFFTERDLTTMLKSIGFEIIEVGFEEVFYDVFHDDYFSDPMPTLQQWKIDVLKQHRQFANDIYVVAEKPQKTNSGSE